MNKHLFGGVFAMILSIVLAVVMMALNGWIGNCQPGESSAGGFPFCYHVGMRVGKIDGYGTFTIDSDVCKGVWGPYCQRWQDGGTIILATGIIAFVIFIVAAVLLMVAHRHGAANYRYGALFGLSITSFLMLLGIILYSYKQLAGYSFILMIISSFLYFVGIALIVTNGWKITLSGDSSDTSSESNKATGAARAKPELEEAI